MNARRLARISGTVLVGVAIFAVSVRFVGWHTVLAQSGSTETKIEAPVAMAPTIKVTSRETVVDVTVTDQDGNPVHGLTRENFTVKEDRKEQPIRSFHEYGSEAVPAPEKLPPNTYSNRQPPAASGAVNILLLDFVNSAAVPALIVPLANDTYERAVAAQRQVKSDAIKYVSTMPAGTTVIVLGLSKSLRTLQGATSDPALLSAAINTMEYNAEGHASDAASYCMQAEMRTRETLESLNQIAADLSTIRGKKNLLWFSVGMPWLTDPSAHAPCLPDYSGPLLKTYGLLAAAQISVYPIDVRGVVPLPNAFVTSRGWLWVNIPFLPAVAHAQAVMDFQQTTADEQLAMESIAEATGGAAYYNSNDLASLIAKAVDKGANYYTLSYVPPGTKYDNGHHSIKVSVDQPGLHLVYRNSYDAVDPATIKPAPGLTLTTAPPDAASGDMKAAMSRNLPTSTQILFDVRVEPSATQSSDQQILGTLDPKLKGKPLTRYDFDYSIPARQITFTGEPNGTHHGSLELDIAVYDTEAKLVSSLSQTINMPLSEERYKQFITGPFRFPQQIDLPPGQLFVRIGVLDKTSNKVGTLEIPLTVAKGQK